MIQIDKESMIEIVERYLDISRDFDIEFYPGEQICELYFTWTFDDWYGEMDYGNAKIRYFDVVAELYKDYDNDNEEFLVLNLSAQNRESAKDKWTKRVVI